MVEIAVLTTLLWYVMIIGMGIALSFFVVFVILRMIVISVRAFYKPNTIDYVEQK
jgi:hypothetical protein